MGRFPNDRRFPTPAGRRSAGVVFLALLFAPSAHAVDFTDVTVAAGLLYTQRATPILDVQPPEAAGQPSGGAAACDVDGDGWVDLIVSRMDAPPILFQNDRQGGFADVTAGAGDLGTSLPAGSNGVGCADLDNDGDQDLYLTSQGTTRFHLFVNQGGGTFAEEAVARGAAVDSGYTHYGMGVGFGDYDRNGYLDVFTAEWWVHPLPPAPPLPGISHNRLLRNLGGTQAGHFVDVTIGAEVELEDPPNLPTTALGTPGFSPGFVDFDLDGWPDLAWVADWGHSRLFWNDRDGTFTDGTVAAGVGLERSGMGTTQDDFDGDGLIDWLATAIFGRAEEIPFGVSNQLYSNNGDRTFTNITIPAGVADGGFGWAASGFDYDNDGDVDIVHTNGMIVPGHPEEERWRSDRTRLFENQGGGLFLEVGAAHGITDTDQGKGLLTFDYDRDGDLDVFIANHADAPVLYRNDGGSENSWLQIACTGTRSNRDGIGAVITVEPSIDDSTSTQTQQLLGNSNFLGHDERIAHFGLGGHATDVERITVEWPSGIVQSVWSTPADARIGIIEPDPILLVEFTESTRTATEGETGSVWLTVAGGDARALGEQTLELSVVGGTATPGEDYTVPAVARIAPADYTAPVPIAVPLTILDDGVDDAGETILFELRRPSDAVAVADVDGLDRARRFLEVTIEESAVEEPECEPATHSQLRVRQRSGSRSSLRWRWAQRGPPGQRPLGDPSSSTIYELRIEDGVGEVAHMVVPAGSVAWRVKKHGFRYRDQPEAADGIMYVALDQRPERTRIAARAKGAPLALPQRTLVLPVRMRLTHSEGSCWEALFDEARKNTPDNFSASTP